MAKKNTTPEKFKPRFNSLEEFKAGIPEAEQYREQRKVPKGGWVKVEYQTSVANKFKEGWTAEEQDAIARGERVCPACLGLGKYTLVERGGSEETAHIFQGRSVPCHCLEWKHLWRLISKELRAYDFVNLDTLKPSQRSALPLEIQQQEYDFVRKYRDENFLFLGDSGTGKTTMAYALYRWAHVRDQRKYKSFWNNGEVYPFDKTRWIWRGNFDSLLLQYNAKLVDREAPEPYVTADKIYAAKDAGRHPVLIIEEVDKTKLNEHRGNFLFHLLEAITNAGGQLVMTSNLTLNEFDAIFMRQEETQVVGEPILRRLTDYVNVRNYFEHYSGE